MKKKCDCPDCKALLRGRILFVLGIAILFLGIFLADALREINRDVGLMMFCLALSGGTMCTWNGARIINRFPVKE